MREEIIKDLKEKNYWWKTNKIKDQDRGIERKEYTKEILRFLSIERIIALAGLRRTGKTTLMFQLMAHLLKQGVKPKNIFYVKTDDIDITKIEEILETYTYLCGTDYKKEKIYVFFDEIHYIENWQKQLKKYFDLKYPIKFVITGSSTTLLFKEASESLMGRIHLINVFPLTFKEFLEFNKFEIKSTVSNFNFKKIEEIYYRLIDKKTTLMRYLDTYLKVGGLPERFKIKDLILWKKTLRDDYFYIIIFKDIIKVYKLANPKLLENLAKEIARLSTERFSYHKLSNRFDVDKNTIKQYLFYLENSRLIKISEKYTKKKIANEKSEKKIYFWEEGLRNALAEIDKSKSIENVVFWHLWKKGLDKNLYFETYYWKNKKEIDFIFEDEKPLPIEIKYQEKPEINGLSEFVKKFDSKQAIVVTKNTFKKEKINNCKVLFVPVWLFLVL